MEKYKLKIIVIIRAIPDVEGDRAIDKIKSRINPIWTRFFYKSGLTIPFVPSPGQYLTLNEKVSIPVELPFYDLEEQVLVRGSFNETVEQCDTIIRNLLELGFVEEVERPFLDLI